MIKLTNILTEGVPMPMDTPNEFAYLDFKKWAYKKRGKIKKQMLSLKDDGGKIFRAMELVWQTWAKSTNNKAYTNVKNPSKFGRALVVMMWKDNLIFNKNTNKITRLKEAEYGTPTGTKTLKSIDAKFDDAVFKVPPHKLTRDWVLKVAKKYKVDPKKAIQWVNLNPKINIKEANYKYFRTYLGKLADEMGDHELLQIATNGSESKLKQYFKRDTDYEKFTDREVKSLSGKKLHNLLKYDKRWNEGKVNEGKRREIQFAAIGHNIVKKVVKNLKPGRDYDFGVGQGGMVLIDIDVKYLDQLVSVLNHKRIRWGIV